MITSKYLSVNAQDCIKGVVAAVAGAVWALIAPNVAAVLADPEHVNFVFDVTAIWHTAAATGILYLAHRFIMPAKKITAAE